MLNAIEPGERRALATVVIMMLMSLGMLGVILPPAAAPERGATVPTPYSAAHAAIPAQPAEEQPPAF